MTKKEHLIRALVTSLLFGLLFLVYIQELFDISNGEVLLMSGIIAFTSYLLFEGGIFVKFLHLE